MSLDCLVRPTVFCQDCINWLLWHTNRFLCCCCSVDKSYPNLCDPHRLHAACQASLYSSMSWSLFRLMSIESVMLSNHLIFCHHSLFTFKSFLASGSFPISRPSIRASTSASVLPMSLQGWFLLVLTGLISLLSKGLSRVFSSTTFRKHQFFSTLPSFIVQLSHLYMTTEKTIALTRQTFVGQVMSLLLDMLSRFVIVFLPRSKHLLISWLQTIHSDFGAQENSPLFPHLFALKWWD